ncbi:MAG TPA: helix-turn-helix transcriptional regulator, partial [Candidatus Avoscillospira avistercoris]|nr:helix-turn-helix transcriptional regulator [Candidatus Avoscillospira avistercoris]
MKPLRKIRYIEITSEILQQEGIESVTIRKVAERAGCTSAVLYKHFENKEHLIMLASVRFLEPYIIEFIKLSSREDL